MRSVCSVDGCDVVVKGHGFCNKHYLRWKKHGAVADGDGSHVSVFERFWNYANKRGPDDCWLWSGTKMGNGYGRIALGGRDGGVISVHRYSCELHHGPPPFKGARVMHKCDNRGCVNPAHLVWCTSSENIQDAYEKGRKVSPFKRGVEHHKASLNDEKVRFVKSHPEMSGAHLSRLLDCSSSSISAIRAGRTWKHVT